MDDAQWKYMCRLHHAGVLYLQFDTNASRSTLMAAYQTMFQPVVVLRQLRHAELKKYTHLRGQHPTEHGQGRKMKAKTKRRRRKVVADDLPTIRPPKRRRDPPKVQQSLSSETAETECELSRYEHGRFGRQQTLIKIECDTNEQPVSAICNNNYVQDNHHTQQKKRPMKQRARLNCKPNRTAAMGTSLTTKRKIANRVLNAQKYGVHRIIRQPTGRPLPSDCRVDHNDQFTSQIDMLTSATETHMWCGVMDRQISFHQAPVIDMRASSNERQNCMTGDQNCGTTLSGSADAKTPFPTDVLDKVNNAAVGASSPVYNNNNTSGRQLILDVNTTASDTLQTIQPPLSRNVLPGRPTNQFCRQNPQRRNKINILSHRTSSTTGTNTEATNVTVTNNDVLTLVNRSIVLQHEYRRCRRELLKVHRMALLTQNQHRFLTKKCRDMENVIYNIEQTVSSFQMANPASGSRTSPSTHTTMPPFVLPCNSTHMSGNRWTNPTLVDPPPPTTAACISNPSVTPHTFAGAAATNSVNDVDRRNVSLSNSTTPGSINRCVPQFRKLTEGPLAVATQPCEQSNVSKHVNGAPGVVQPICQTASSHLGTTNRHADNAIHQTNQVHIEAGPHTMSLPRLTQNADGPAATTNGYCYLTPAGTSVVANTGHTTTLTCPDRATHGTSRHIIPLAEIEVAPGNTSIVVKPMFKTNLQHARLRLMQLARRPTNT